MLLPEVEAIAEHLRAAIERRLGVPVRIIHGTAPADGPIVRRTNFTGGNPYGGNQYSDNVVLEGAGALSVRFDVWEHDLSGQCDSWTLDIKGAEPDERAAFVELFHPRQRRGSWGSNPTITVTFNGVLGGF